MNLIKQFIIGGIIGFIAISIFFLIPFTKISFPIETVTIILYVIVLISWLYNMIVANKIKKMTKVDLEGDAEDDVKAEIDKRFYDFSLSTNIGAVLAVLGLSLAVIEMYTTLVVIGIIATIISSSMGAYMIRVMKQAYPERNLPDPGEKQYAKKLMDISDEGEKHLMLHGLYKVFTFANAALLVSIMIIAIYSVVSENSQLFSMAVIAIILIIMNGMYFLSIRNK